MTFTELRDFKKISTIIARDAKDSTYKFALLRAVVEISQEYPHFGNTVKDKIVFPLGLVVQKWLLYYYPLIESSLFIPQKHGERLTSQKKIAFRPLFKKITDYYSDKGRFSVFYRDYVNDSIPLEIFNDFVALIRALARTIKTMPMRYLGRSVFEKEYSIFNPEKTRIRPVKENMGQEFVLNNLGTFSFPVELYEVFQYLGSYLSGETSILYRWAEFCHNVQPELEFEYILKKLRVSPTTEKDYYEARAAYEKIYEQQKGLECVWSGRAIKKLRDLQIDHMIPFSILKNNDLWNLLPSHKSINIRKGDKIPSPDLIGNRHGMIVHYWNELSKSFPKRFKRQITLSLTGTITNPVMWSSLAIRRLKDRCRYLIDIRGLEEWIV